MPMNVTAASVVPTASAAPWRLCVAPMMEWTDRHCRYFHRLLAPHARLYTEMVTSAAVVHGDREHLLGHDASEHPLAVQLGGSEPGELAAAATIAADLGHDEVNLNVGCPSDRVQSGRFGACLMREPELVAECVAAMRRALDAAGHAIPVTVKCRLGVDEQDEETALETVVEGAAAAGCGVFVVHARKAWLAGLSPKQNREVPPLNHARVQRLKRDHPELVVVVNGGLASLDDVLAQLRVVDGVMLGRTAYHDPWRLAEIEHALFGTPLPEREAVLERLRPYVEAQLARGVRLAQVTRHVLGLYQGLPGARAWRRVLSEESHAADAGWDVVARAEAARRQRHAA